MLTRPGRILPTSKAEKDRVLLSRKVCVMDGNVVLAGTSETSRLLSILRQLDKCHS